MKTLALTLLLLSTVPAFAQKTAKAAPKAVADKPKCDGGLESSDGFQTFGCRNGKWVDTTQETWTDFARINKHRDELYFALRSRVLTSAEMEEVVELDWQIGEHLSLMGSYGPNYETEKRKQFNDALLQQFKLRIAAEKAKIKD